MTADVNQILEGKRGDEYINTLREIAILASATGKTVRCGACPNAANWIGMQKCGTPGGPVCDTCLQHHRDWIDTCDSITGARPFCRHCGNDVDRGHIYAASLYDTTAAPVDV